MEDIYCTVVVVGGGPSGATAARVLAANGVDVLLLEKDMAFEKPCGGGLFVKAFDEFDIPKELITKHIDTIEIVSPALERIAVDISDSPLGVVHRQEFDSRLRQLAKEAGARISNGKVHDITPKDDYTTLFVYLDDGIEMKLNTKYVIAADGVNSIVRKKLLGNPPSRKLTHYADISNEESKSCQFWFGDDISPKHYAWIFPHYRGINIGLIADNERRAPTLFRSLTSKSSLDSKTYNKKGYFIPYWKEQTLYRDSVFYVGDSASLVLPFTYEGIYYAMKSGKLAAEAIIKNQPLLYEKNWNKLYLKKFRFLRLLQSVFLRNNWMTSKMIALYKKPRFQKSVLGYWSGSKEPEGFTRTLFKVIKVLLVGYK